MKKSVILLLTLVLCSILAVPTLAGTSNSGIFNGRFETHVNDEGVIVQGFKDNAAFTILDKNLQKYLTKKITTLTNNDRIVSPVLASPVVWSKGWLLGEVGSWMTCDIVWKTMNGVERYSFEVCYDGKSYTITKEDTMIDHYKVVNR